MTVSGEQFNHYSKKPERMYNIWNEVSSEIIFFKCKKMKTKHSTIQVIQNQDQNAISIRYGLKLSVFLFCSCMRGGVQFVYFFFVLMDEEFWSDRDVITSMTKFFLCNKLIFFIQFFCVRKFCVPSPKLFVCNFWRRRKQNNRIKKYQNVK